MMSESKLIPIDALNVIDLVKKLDFPGVCGSKGEEYAFEIIKNKSLIPVNGAGGIVKKALNREAIYSRHTPGT